MEYVVAPVLAVHASATWPLPAVAVSPFGVAGADGVGVGDGVGDESPPPQAARARVESVTMGAAIDSLERFV